MYFFSTNPGLHYTIDSPSTSQGEHSMMSRKRDTKGKNTKATNDQHFADFVVVVVRSFCSN